ncbi:MAG: hypothetical protein WCM76_15615 [Bacteroidota bacterium]
MSEIVSKLKVPSEGNILVLNAPIEFQELIKEVSFDTVPANTRLGKYDYVQIFSVTQKSIDALIKQYAKAGKRDCMLWLTYPKSGGTIKSDIKREAVVKALEKSKLKAVTTVVIDETWSALRARPA